MADAGETHRPAEGLLGALAGNSLAATLIPGAIFLSCPGVLVFVHGNERLISPMVRGPGLR